MNNLTAENVIIKPAMALQKKGRIIIIGPFQKFFKKIVMEIVAEKIFDNLSDSPFYHVILEDLKNRKIDPFAAAEQLTDRLHYGV